MTANAADFGASTLSTLARALGLAVLALGAVLAFVFAFVAALVVGLMIFGAALAMRLTPRRAPAAAPGVLNARRTPTGWVVETSAHRR